MVYMARKGKTTRTNKKHAPDDPRVDMFKQFYLRPDSYTFMNARQSALRAGYTEHYANSITCNNGPVWYTEMIQSGDYRRAQMLDAAEKNLLETIEEVTDDIQAKKLKHDATKFVSERLGKQHYSTRQEVTGADGRRLFDSETREESAVDLQNLFAGVKDAD